MKASEILRGAKSRIEQGWSQCSLAEDERGAEVLPISASACKFCALGAMAAAYHEKPEGFDQTKYLGGMEHSEEGKIALAHLEEAALEKSSPELAEAMSSDHPEVHKSIWRFNDSNETTKETVLAAFELAAKNAEEAENAVD